MTAAAIHLLNLLSVSRLVSVLDEVDDCCAICKFQELDRGVGKGVVICIQGEQQWGENPEGCHC